MARSKQSASEDHERNQRSMTVFPADVPHFHARDFFGIRKSHNNTFGIRKSHKTNSNKKLRNDAEAQESALQSGL